VPDRPDGRRRSRAALGAVGRTGFLLIAVLLATATTGWRLAVALGCCWTISLVVHPSGFLVLRRLTLWGLLTLLALPPLLLLTPRDIALPLGLAVSVEGCDLALTMLARSLMIVVAAAGFASTVSVHDVTGVLEMVGLRGLGFSLGVAVHALPLARQTWATSARALRLRGGFRHHWVRDVALLAMTVVGNALRHADEVVEAAQARGFSPDRPERTRPDRWRSDVAWLIVLTGLACVLAFA
jgi:energy-coupling factor transporter transmembrane protein EcfT